MASEVKVPRLAQGMESGTIVRWLKSEGDDVREGEPLYEIDTEKVTQEVEAEAVGRLLRILVPAGEVPVGTTIAWIGAEGESLTTADARPAQGTTALKTAPTHAGEASVAVTAGANGENGRIKASPLARRIAGERGVELAALTGTGPEGRIVAEDVERAAAQPLRAAVAAPPMPPVAPGEPTRVPLTSVRRTTARRLTEAWAVPAFQLTISVELTRVSELVARHRNLVPEVRLTVTDVLTKACARALLLHSAVNAQYTDEAILRFPTANVGLATATPDGLFVPVIRSAERLSLAEIAAARAELVSRARAGALQTEDLAGGTFTISNLGALGDGITQFVAVLNPPQAAILAVGAAEERVLVRGGEPAVVPMLTLTATFDHRAVDGADGAAFLRSVRLLLEEPGLSL